MTAFQGMCTFGSRFLLLSMRFYCLMLLTGLVGRVACGQTPYDSEGLVKYDYLTHKTDKPIPFDRSFTLVVEHFPVKDVVAVQAFEARYTNGVRSLVPVELDAAGAVIATKAKTVAQTQRANDAELLSLKSSFDKNGATPFVPLTPGELATVQQVQARANSRAAAIGTVLSQISARVPRTLAQTVAAGLPPSAVSKTFTEAEEAQLRASQTLAQEKAAALTKLAAGINLTATEIEAGSQALRDVHSIKDISLLYTVSTDGLQVFFPPLQPNKVFDLLITSKLSALDQGGLLDVNALLFQSVADPTKLAEAEGAFDQVRSHGLDPFLQRTAFDVDFGEYQALYQQDFAATYTRLADPATFPLAPALSEAQLRAVALAAKNAPVRFPRLGAGMEMLSPGLAQAFQLGLLPVTGLYQRKPVDLASLHTRLVNLDANMMYADSLQHVVDAALLYQAGRVSPDLIAARTAVDGLRTGLRRNRALLANGLKLINQNLGGKKQLRQVSTLAGGTLASDLKTAGGNVLFLDAGLTDMVVPGLRDQVVHIPRLYSGVSIYFRPIDKNTRRNRFPKQFDPPPQGGLDPDSDADARAFGPDYGIVSRACVLQHLSLSLGFTLGALPNKDFDNLYNNMSLLAGPAYRFKRAFKVSAGVSLLMRTSKNPVESNKVVTPGVYVSLSSDIDFIQGLKDLTGALFK